MMSMPFASGPGNHHMEPGRQERFFDINENGYAASDALGLKTCCTHSYLLGGSWHSSPMDLNFSLGAPQTGHLSGDLPSAT